MNLGDFLELLVDAQIDGSHVKCYKRVYISYINKDGKKSTSEFNYETKNEIKKSYYELKLVSLESIKKHSFLISNGLEIYVTVLTF